MKSPELIELVRKEADALRAHATQEEKDKLNIRTLDPQNMHNCIYGQMTGSCYSRRAHTLLDVCAVKMITPKMYHLTKSYGICKIEDKDISDSLGTDDRGRNYSPIETFIVIQKNITNGNNERLMDYIQGKTNELEFELF